MRCFLVAFVLYWNGQNEFVHQIWEFICGGFTHSLYLSGCPRHVGRNYVPLLFGVDTDIRYYVIRDVIVI